MLNGQALREKRLRAGLTVKDLAEKSGLSEATIELIETGKRNAINDRTLIDLAKGFGVDVVELEKVLKEGNGGSPEPKAVTA